MEKVQLDRRMPHGTANISRYNFILVAAIALNLTTAMGVALADGERAAARQATDDMIRHFWVGDESSGHILDTSHGYAGARATLWERAIFIIALDDASLALSDPSCAHRIQADWKRTKSLYTPAQLEACGSDSGTNWAADDAGWTALMYLAAFRASGDRDALERARGLVNHAFDRWLDDDLGGGMWYRDDHAVKSLYQIAIVLAALRISELTGEGSFHDRALNCYQWIEGHLLRGDGLYWCDYNRAGPAGLSRPNDIREAGSVVFLGGNMAMAVAHARLFRTTGNDIYRQCAIRTANGIFDHLTTARGIYINDRDAWTNGAFAGDYAREVLSLPGIDPKHTAALLATARSIGRNARTADGFFSGSWSGPAEGSDSRWFVKGSKPSQIMTSASTVNMIIAAFLAEDSNNASSRPIRAREEAK